MQKNKKSMGVWGLNKAQSQITDFQPNLSSCFYSEITQKTLRKTNIFPLHYMQKKLQEKFYICLWKQQTFMLISTLARLNATTN